MVENNTVVFAFIVCTLLTVVKCSEPMCSKFDYQEQLLEKMIRTEIKVETMEKSIKTTQTEMMNVLKSLQFEIHNELNKTQTEVKDQLKTLSGERKTFEDGMALLRKESLDKMNTAISTMETTSQQMKGQIRRISEDLVKLTDQAVTPTVVFMARSVVDRSPATGQIIVFSTNILNEGEGYDNSNGIFTAPVTGLYLFTVHFCTRTGNYISFAIIVDDQQITVSTMGAHDNYVCSSADTTTVMTTGMKVWVKCTYGYSSSVLVEDGSRWNTFSGLLVHK